MIALPLLAALLLSAGCGGAPGPVGGRAESVRTMTASPEPTLKHKSSMPPADEEPEPNAGACNPTGSENARLVLEDVGDALMVMWEGQPIAPTGTTGYYVTIYDADGNGGQLGVKYLDGKQIAYFVADLGAGQVNLDGPADRDRNRNSITVRFPKDVGFPWGVDVVKWSAAYTLNGSDVGRCPGAAGGTLPFPG